MTPMWAWFGHDEPNYTYMKDGKKLLSELAALSPTPVFVRTHNLLTTGDGTPALKWGSTNAYTEDAQGRPVYDWTIVDRIFDTYMERKMKPLVEIGFMPEALSTNPVPYRHSWVPGRPYGDIYTGWAYPPKDYGKWRDLVYEWVRHAVSKYGQREVESWYWEVWNEPDISYWRGTREEFMKLYDYAADGLKRALPTAKIGGPHITGPVSQGTQQYLREFIEHCLRGTNFATGKIGTPLDFVAFHAKGAPRVMPEGHVRMGVSNQLRAINNGFAVVASFPELRNVPIVIGESDPEGCAACPVSTTPSNAYRNGTMYSSYTAEQIARTYELADLHKVNLLGSVTWAFEFEDQPYFYGFRDLATNGIDKPVLNVFRMLGMMAGDRVAVESSGGLPLATVRDSGVRTSADVHALATRSARSIAVMVWNYHDDDLPGPAAEIALEIAGAPAGARMRQQHFRVDPGTSNAYAVWLKMGSPQQPTPAQYAELERSGRLQSVGPDATVTPADGRVTVRLTLPRQGVSLIRLSWTRSLSEDDDEHEDTERHERRTSPVAKRSSRSASSAPDSRSSGVIRGQGQNIVAGGAPVEIVVSSVSPITARITVLPIASGVVGAIPVDGALVQSEWGQALARARSAAPLKSVQAGQLRVRFTDAPPTIVVETKSGEVVQRLTLDPVAPTLTFLLPKGPLLGLGEGGPQFDRKGTVDRGRSGQGGYMLRTHGGRVPIQWMVGTTDGWGMYIHQPLGAFDFSRRRRQVHADGDAADAAGRQSGQRAAGGCGHGDGAARRVRGRLERSGDADARVRAHHRTAGDAGAVDLRVSAIASHARGPGSDPRCRAHVPREEASLRCA